MCIVPKMCDQTCHLTGKSTKKSIGITPAIMENLFCPQRLISNKLVQAKKCKLFLQRLFDDFLFSNSSHSGAHLNLSESWRFFLFIFQAPSRPLLSVKWVLFPASGPDRYRADDQSDDTQDHDQHPPANRRARSAGCWQGWQRDEDRFDSRHGWGALWVTFEFGRLFSEYLVALLSCAIRMISILKCPIDLEKIYPSGWGKQPTSSSGVQSVRRERKKGGGRIHFRGGVLLFLVPSSP